MTTTTFSTTADLLPLLPEMVLVGGSFALLMLDLFLDAQRRVVTHVLALALLAWATGQWPTARDLALRHGLGRQELLLLAAVFVVTHVLFWMLAWGTSTEGQAAALFREMGLGQGTGQDLAILFSAVILAPVCEEILFRGIMLRAVHDHVQRRGYRHLAVVLALVVSAVAFAMPHLGDSLVGRLALA